MHTYLIEQMQYVEALEYLDEQLENNPKDAIMLFYKGKVLSHLGLFHEAIEVFDYAEEISPNYTDSARYKKILIDYLTQSGKHTRHEESNKSNPKYSANVLIYQGVANFYRQRYDEAISLYEKALKIVPRNIFALFYTGNAFAKLKNHESAIEYYDIALQIDAENLDELIFKGIGFYRLERYREAVLCFQKAEKLITEEKDEVVLILIGNTLIKMEKFDDAINYFDKILKKYPDHPGAKEGKMRAQFGKFDGNSVPYYR